MNKDPIRFFGFASGMPFGSTLRPLRSGKAASVSEYLSLSIPWSYFNTTTHPCITTMLQSIQLQKEILSEIAGRQHLSAML
jgi:hypothetical protein